MSQPDCLIIGAGIYGVTAAVELRARGYDVTLIDPGPVPHPLAASTDISKVVRMEYGADPEYMALVDEAITGWHEWNDELEDVLYHEVGIVMLARSPMAPGGFEHESYHNLLERGREPERLDADEIARRFPGWKPGAYVDGFFHARGGFAESGRVVSALLDHGRSEGVVVHEGQTADRLLREGDRIIGVRTREGGDFAAEHVVVCAGAWTELLVPELEGALRATGHPVFHVKPDPTEAFEPERFPVFTADVSRTGWYGFPLHPREGVVKIANHGVGVRVHPESDAREVTESDHRRFRDFLAGTFPALADAPIVYTRLCLYSDTLDEHLWISRHPEIENLTVAAGGSGHAFKMAPLLGDFVADTVEGEPNPWCDRFRWRELDPGAGGKEEARHHG